MAIPKIIHYCWFGENALPHLEQKCLDTWTSKLEEYNFMLWNEENSLLEIPFVKFAYENRKWAYVSDYVRLKSLYDYGGIYLDTDMRVVKNLDPFLSETCFFGAESSTRISCGIIGAEKHNPFIKKCLEYYENIENIDLGHFKIPITKIITRVFREYFHYQNDFSNVLRKEGVTIFSSDFFYPIPYNEFKKPIHKEFETYAEKNTYAIHLWSGSWQSVNEFQFIANGKYFKALQVILKKINSKNIYKKKYLKKMIKAYKISKKN